MFVRARACDDRHKSNVNESDAHAGLPNCATCSYDALAQYAFFDRNLLRRDKSS